MSYTKLVKKWEKEYNQKIKIELTQQKERQLREERINTAFICEELMNGIRQRRKQEELTQIKDTILLSLRKNNPFTYREYLILWDIIVTNDYYQIQSDLYKGKISKVDITKVIDYIKSFSNELINKYWINKIMEG